LTLPGRSAKESSKQAEHRYEDRESEDLASPAGSVILIWVGRRLGRLAGRARALGARRRGAGSPSFCSGATRARSRRRAASAAGARMGWLRRLDRVPNVTRVLPNDVITIGELELRHAAVRGDELDALVAGAASALEGDGHGAIAHRHGDGNRGRVVGEFELVLKRRVLRPANHRQ
jgi:hypothetical protein